jgi:hypothetical protein
MDYLKCPLCGGRTRINRIGQDYTLFLSSCEIGGRGKAKWSIKYGGYTALKKLLVPILEKIIFRLDKLNGCDQWPDCLSCLVPLEQCPDTTARALQKSRSHNHVEQAQALRESDKSTLEIAEIMNKSQEQVRRYLREDIKK